MDPARDIRETFWQMVLNDEETVALIAGYELIHRDTGPKVRYLGPGMAAGDLPWRDPIPALDHAVVEASEIADLKSTILGGGHSVSKLISAAWSSASNCRHSDQRGAAKAARVMLDPQKGRKVDRPGELGPVLGGCAAVETAVRDAGVDMDVPFVPGRMDASRKWMDDTFEWLKAGFRRVSELPQRGRWLLRPAGAHLSRLGRAFDAVRTGMDRPV